MIVCSDESGILRELAVAAKAELVDSILPYWIRFSRDIPSGGFFGFMENDNAGDAEVPRSVVMVARQLWSYSAAFRRLQDDSYLELADYAYKALSQTYWDTEFGGVYWSVDSASQPVVTKKQIYGEAFAIYGLSEYAGVLWESNRKEEGENVLALALSLFDFLDKYAWDRVFGGYTEACARDWSATSDLKLSDKDMDCHKSMNTNLHVLEALTTLYRVVASFYGSEDSRLVSIRATLSALVQLSIEKILGADAHLDLYFNRDWSPIGDTVSYGHDIEASWLIWEALCELGDECLKITYKPRLLKIAETSLSEGFDRVDECIGALCNESQDGYRDCTRIWWCQAEGMVGFFNAWQLTGLRKYLLAVRDIWNWVETGQKDREHGEWFANVLPSGIVDPHIPKGGNWKTPYHNGRCCMELLDRIKLGSL